MQKQGDLLQARTEQATPLPSKVHRLPTLANQKTQAICSFIAISQKITWSIPRRQRLSPAKKAKAKAIYKRGTMLDRRRVMMDVSAETLRSCRDELRRLVKWYAQG